jgi:hypothetical protein
MGKSTVEFSHPGILHGFVVASAGSSTGTKRKRRAGRCAAIGRRPEARSFDAGESEIALVEI